MDLTTMTYEVRDGVAHVRFDRPEGANAVNPAFSSDLRAVMVAIEFDDDVPFMQVQPIRQADYADSRLNDITVVGDIGGLTDEDWSLYLETVVNPNVADDRRRGAYAARVRKAGSVRRAEAAK